MTMLEIPARDLARVLPFRANEDTRYALNGVSVEPHDGGCLLVATNGHWLAAIDSEQARAERPLILNVSSSFEKAIRQADDFTGARVTVADGQSRAVLLDERGSERYIEPGLPFIDGPFPDWRRVVPPVEYLRPGLLATLQTKYISRLHRAMPAMIGFPGVRFWHDERGPLVNAVVARFTADPGLVVVIMPLRIDGESAETTWPSWFLQTSPATEAAK